MPRRRNRGGRGAAKRQAAAEPNENSGAESDGVLDLECEVEGGTPVTEKQAEEPQPGPSNKSKSARGGKGKGKKTDRSEFGAEKAGPINRMSELIDDVIKFLKDIAIGILPLLQGKEHEDEKKKVLQRLHGIGVDMIQAQLRLSIVPDAIMTAYNELDIEELVQNEKDDQQVVLLLQEFEEASGKEIEKRNGDIGYKEVRKNAKYQQFLEVLDQYYDRPGEKVEKEETGVAEPVPEVSEVLDVSSEGLEALNEYLPTTDPFTKMTLKDPYINRICKHVYEYQSVMDMMITSGNKTRCPYVGCSNKKYIIPDDLVKEPVIAAKIIERVQDEICGVYMTVD